MSALWFLKDHTRFKAAHDRPWNPCCSCFEFQLLLRPSPTVLIPSRGTTSAGKPPLPDLSPVSLTDHYTFKIHTSRLLVIIVMIFKTQRDTPTCLSLLSITYFTLTSSWGGHYYRSQCTGEATGTHRGYIAFPHYIQAGLQLRDTSKERSAVPSICSSTISKSPQMLHLIMFNPAQIKEPQVEVLITHAENARL